MVVGELAWVTSCVTMQKHEWNPFAMTPVGHHDDGVGIVLAQDSSMAYVLLPDAGFVWVSKSAVEKLIGEVHL